MRVLTVIMIAIVLLLQYRIWFGQHGVRDYRELQQELARQEQINNTLTQRNQLIEADIRDLRFQYRWNFVNARHVFQGNNGSLGDISK